MPPRYVYGWNRSFECGCCLFLVESHTFVKITPNSHFTNDLGLDSLDTVEVVMAIEEVTFTPF